MSQLTADFPVSEPAHFSQQTPSPEQDNMFPSSALTPYEEGNRTPRKATEWTSKAMVYSSLAADHMQKQHFDQALTSYQQALRMYRQDYLKGGVVDKCNAAATLHNMGLLHKKCKRYHQAIACLEEAEVLYRECSAQTEPQKKGDGVCLESLLAETLQNRANLHSKHHRDIPAAIDCQEEVVTMLLDLGYSPQQQLKKIPAVSPKTPSGENVVYVRITDDQKVHLLSISLRSLGNLYLQQGEQDDALGAYQEALDMLRCRQSKFPNLNLQKKIASILLSMACVYFAQNELDQAVVALDECIAMHGEDQTHPDVITALNNLGLAYEGKGDLDMAMQCYEDMLELRRRQLGDNHVQVAEALITVAKMLERQGNMADALERYQESLEIYRGALSNEDQSFGRNVAEVLSKISSLSNERGSVNDAVSAYQQALTTRNSKTGETALDEARVFVGLARSFSQKGSFQAANDCLTEARQLLRSLPRDDEQVDEALHEIAELEHSANLDMLKQRDSVVPLLLDGPSGNLERVVEEIPEEVIAEGTLERSVKEVSDEVAALETRVRALVELPGDVAGEEVHCCVEELAEHFTELSVEVNDARLLEDSIARSPETTRKVTKATQEEDVSSSEDIPASLLPSAASPESVSFEPSDPAECSSSEHLLRQIMVADQTESAIELQCIVLRETKSIESTSVSTRSVTPESSLEEPSPPLMDSFDGMQLTKGNEETEIADSELKRAVLEAVDIGETSSIPGDDIVDTFDTMPSFLFGDALSLGSCSAKSVSPENAASSIGLNAYWSATQPMNYAGSKALVLTDSMSAEKKIEGVRIGESLHAIEVAAVELLTTEGDANLEYDVSADEFDISNPNHPSPEHDDSGYEYDSFGEGSMSETDSEDGESDLYDYESADLDFAAEKGEHTGSREDIYWDEDENREVQLTESQDYTEGYPFGAPLGLKQKGVSVLINRNVDITRQSGEPHVSEGPQSNHQLSRASGKSSSPPSTPQKSPAQVADPKTSPRHRFVKALSRPFRRRSQLPHKLEPTPEDEVSNIHYRPSSTSQRHLDFSQAGFDDESASKDEFNGPLDFVRMRSVSYDDSVSQITFRHDDFLSRRSDNDGQEWSWGLNIFADIAEDFLSAKSIHNRSRKAEDNDSYSTSSGEESDPFEDLSEKDTVETRTGAQLDAVKIPVELSISISPDSEIQDDPTAPQLPTAAPGLNVEGIVHEVNSTMWQQPAMLALSPKRRTGSPKIQIRIDSSEKSLQEEKLRLGYLDETVATSLVRLGLLRAECGDTDIAIESILEALSIQKELRDPQAMARSLHFLADIYCQQEQYDLALQVYSDVQRIERRLFGPDHPDNANTLNKIGRAYSNKGLFYQAMEKHQQALQVLKACVGENLNHPAVCKTLIHIGEVYYRERNSLSTIRNSADDYKKFIETGMLDIIARAHEGRGSYKIALGFLEEKLQLIRNEKSDFPKDQLARLLYNVGTLSCKSGVFLEAIDYYEQALDIQVQRGCNDVDVATAKVLIGTVEFHIGQYRKSLNLLEGALAVFEKEFGSEHEVVADTLHRIGIAKAALWHLDDAMENLERALSLQLKLFGENDLEVLQTRLEICWIEMNQGETDNVAAHVKGIMQKQQSLVGKSHPIVADTLLLLGKAYLLADNSSKAVKAFQESFHMRERFLGRDHPLQAEAFHLIAIEGIRREKFQHSLGMCNSVLNIRRETLGERHLDVASTLSSIGRCFAGVGKFVEAFRSFDDALQIAQESVGENHPCVGDIYVGKGSLYLRKCQFRSAKESIDKGIEIYRIAEIHEYHDRMKAATKLLEKVVRDEMLCV